MRNVPSFICWQEKGYINFSWDHQVSGEYPIFLVIEASQNQEPKKQRKVDMRQDSRDPYPLEIDYQSGVQLKRFYGILVNDREDWETEFRHCRNNITPCDVIVGSAIVEYSFDEVIHLERGTVLRLNVCSDYAVEAGLLEYRYRCDNGVEICFPLPRLNAGEKNTFDHILIPQNVQVFLSGVEGTKGNITIKELKPPSAFQRFKEVIKKIMQGG